MLSLITHAQSSAYTPQPIYQAPSPLFQQLRPFYSLSQLHHETASHPSLGVNKSPERGRAVRRTQGTPQKWPRKIQPNLGLPCTRSPLTSAIITLLAYRLSSILSTCPNHLNTLCLTLLANSLPIPALLRTSSFLILSIRDTLTKLLKHFI